MNQVNKRPIGQKCWIWTGTCVCRARIYGYSQVQLNKTTTVEMAEISVLTNQGDWSSPAYLSIPKDIADTRDEAIQIGIKRLREDADREIAKVLDSFSEKVEKMFFSPTPEEKE